MRDTSLAALKAVEERLRWKYVYALTLRKRFEGSQDELFALTEIAWHHLRHLDPSAAASLRIKLLPPSKVARKIGAIRARNWRPRSPAPQAKL